MNTEPSPASTFVPCAVNGPTALPHDAALAAIDPPPSPSGSSSVTTTSGASTSAAPWTSHGQLDRSQPDRRQLDSQPDSRPGPAGVMDPFHVATGKLPPELHGRRGRELLFRYRVMEQAMAWLRRDNNALILPGAAS